MGLSCSMIHLILIIFFAMMKFAFIVIKHNPSISEFDEIDQHLTEEEGIDLEKINFQMAIVVTDSSTGEILHDPRYVDF